MTALRLGVNVDHVATVRNARGGAVPIPSARRFLAIEAGADGITAHLREDRRHIHDDDMAAGSRTLDKAGSRSISKWPTPSVLDHCVDASVPHACCIVPEKRDRGTTEGGLDVVGGF